MNYDVDKICEYLTKTYQEEKNYSYVLYEPGIWNITVKMKYLDEFKADPDSLMFDFSVYAPVDITVLDRETDKELYSLGTNVCVFSGFGSKNKVTVTLSVYPNVLKQGDRVLDPDTAIFYMNELWKLNGQSLDVFYNKCLGGTA